MKYGNCLIGLIPLILHHRKGRLVAMRNKGEWLLHFGWLVDGILYDFKPTTKSFVLSVFLYRGKYRARKFENILRWAAKPTADFEVVIK